MNHAAALVTGAMIKGDEVTYRPAVSAECEAELDRTERLDARESAARFAAGLGLELGADVTGDE